MHLYNRQQPDDILSNVPPKATLVVHIGTWYRNDAEDEAHSYPYRSDMRKLVAHLRAARLSSGAGTLWCRRESGRLPPPGTQETIDTALESSWRGERSFVETKSSFEVVRARGADQI